MKKICLNTLFLCLTAICLWGCFGSAPISRYYLLDYVPSTNEQLKTQVHPYTLRIKDFTVAEAYARPEIVYRKSAHELRFYSFHQWAVKPEHLLSDMIFKHMRHARLFKNTVQSGLDFKPDYIMTGQVVAIEEYDNQENWYAHLTINFQVESETSKEIIWQRNFDVRKIVAQHEPVYVVRELSFLLENTMDKVIKELDKVFQEKAGLPLDSGEPKDSDPTSPLDLIQNPEKPDSTIKK